MPDTIQLDQRDGVLMVTLNRPDVLNAINDQMLRELFDALRQADREAAVRCVVLTGSGRGFCSGQDLRDRVGTGTPSFRESLGTRYNPVIRQMRTMEKPILAAVNGVAAGAGCSLALAADLRIASDRASFIEVFARIGLVPDSGSTYFLPRLVGLGKALELAYTADAVDAAEALRMGLVNRVVPHDALFTEVTTLATRLAAGPTRGYGLAKRAINYGLHATLDQALEYEAAVQEIAGRSADHHEGVAAFLAKRQPFFTGN
jgi:2-(1,2-epoxy-1,2-dihydrophenyl)acetyl-CoA isomerase